jgi:hypothetical protein
VELKPQRVLNHLNIGDNSVISEVQVRLVGGVGNQIFQFLAGKLIAERFDVPLQIDIKMLNSPNAHLGSDIRELELFNSDGEVSLGSDLFGKDFLTRVQIKLAKRLSFFSRISNLYCAEEINFEELSKFKSVVKLSGYFQTKQITDFACTRYPGLRLQPKNPSKQFAAAINQINGEFCAIHVRRGDYLNRGSIHSQLNSHYYLEAIRNIREKTKDNTIKYVLFSDEPNFASTLLPSDLNYIHAADFKLSTVEELCLMGQANAFIIANSTFSFWPAFLAGKQCPVVMPSQWFKSGEESINRIMPTHWHSISN